MRRATTAVNDEHCDTIISIHALREESDSAASSTFASKTVFQSTLSVRRATWTRVCKTKDIDISIHALREESDPSTNLRPLHTYLFQSTLSVRRATRTAAALAGGMEFQSTLSVRRATGATYVQIKQANISIHALREESDIVHDRPCGKRPHFNPRSP